MKPTLVDNCEHYNFVTHVCNKCGRGLPDVCLEFEEMKRKATAFEKHETQTENRDMGKDSEPDFGQRQSLQMESVQAQQTKKARGRPRKVTDDQQNATD